MLAALNEAQLLREQGWDQTDEPARWALTLNAARSAQRRADAVLASGEPTDDLRLKVDAAALDLTRDERDQMLLAELDRIADSNEIRLLIPVSFTGVTARQYAEAFRKHGMDLLAAPTNEAVAWLKSHRLRHRLVIAIRNWQLSFPGWDVNSVADTTVMAGGRHIGRGRRISRHRRACGGSPRWVRSASAENGPICPAHRNPEGRDR